jgi:hypothetical protein
MASIHERTGPKGKAYRVQYRDCFGHQYARTFNTLIAARGFQSAINRLQRKWRAEIFRARGQYAVNQLQRQIEHSRNAWLARDFWLVKQGAELT